jgi:hypothetical protein
MVFEPDLPLLRIAHERRENRHAYRKVEVCSLSRRWTESDRYCLTAGETET